MDHTFTFSLAVLFIIFVMFMFECTRKSLNEAKKEISRLRNTVDEQRFALESQGGELLDLRKMIKKPPECSSNKSTWTMERSQKIDHTDDLLKMLIEDLGYEICVVSPGFKIERKQK